MEVTVLFFSTLRQITGTESLPWPLPTGATVGDLLAALYARFPALREWDEQILVAVDLAYADRGQALRAGQEVAIMPPVQGG